MTDEQINCAIAEACGWKMVVDNPDYEPYWECPKTGRMVAAASSKFPSYNYCNDLNAMHEAEKILITDANFETYYLSLYDTTYSTIWPVCATARQRAEALLRTLGKWKEGK